LTGSYGPRRGNAPVGSISGNTVSCTAHNFNFIPGTRILVGAWIAGGTSVLDLSDPMAVKELAYYRPDGSVAMSAFWYRGLIYVADMDLGFEVLKLDL
jgi:hypothetical protein